MQEKFLRDDGYSEGDTVILSNKQWRIKRIKGNTAELFYQAGVGEPQKQSIKLSSLPAKAVVMAMPVYEAGQKLANGWSIVKVIRLGEYMVNVNGDKVVMMAKDLRKAEEDYLHAEAERVALEAVAKTSHPPLNLPPLHKGRLQDDDEGGEKALSDTPAPSTASDEDGDKLVEILRTLGAVIDQIADVDQKLSKIDELEKTVKGYGRRLDALERPVTIKNGRAVAHQDDKPLIEVKTLIQTITPDADGEPDTELEEFRNDGWQVVHMSHHNDASKVRIVTLERVRDQDEAGVPTESKGSVVNAVSPHVVPKVVMGTVMGVGESVMGNDYHPLMDAKMLQMQMDDEIKRNTIRIMESA